MHWRKEPQSSNASQSIIHQNLPQWFPSFCDGFITLLQSTPVLSLLLSGQIILSALWTNFSQIWLMAPSVGVRLVSCKYRCEYSLHHHAHTDAEGTSPFLAKIRPKSRHYGWVVSEASYEQQAAAISIRTEPGHTVHPRSHYHIEFQKKTSSDNDARPETKKMVKAPPHYQAKNDCQQTR